MLWEVGGWAVLPSWRIEAEGGREATFCVDVAVDVAMLDGAGGTVDLVAGIAAAARGGGAFGVAFISGSKRARSSALS